MPAWLVALLAQLPEIIAAINAIITAASGNPTSDQMDQLAAYAATIDGINQALAYHANA